MLVSKTEDFGSYPNVPAKMKETLRELEFELETRSKVCLFFKTDPYGSDKLYSCTDKWMNMHKLQLAKNKIRQFVIEEYKTNVIRHELSVDKENELSEYSEIEIFDKKGNSEKFLQELQYWIADNQVSFETIKYYKYTYEIGTI